MTKGDIYNKVKGYIRKDFHIEDKIKKLEQC